MGLQADIGYNQEPFHHDTIPQANNIGIMISYQSFWLIRNRPTCVKIAANDIIAAPTYHQAVKWNL